MTKRCVLNDDLAGGGLVVSAVHMGAFGNQSTDGPDGWPSITVSDVAGHEASYSLGFDRRHLDAANNRCAELENLLWRAERAVESVKRELILKEEIYRKASFKYYDIQNTLKAAAILEKENVTKLTKEIDRIQARLRGLVMANCAASDEIRRANLKIKRRDKKIATLKSLLKAVGKDK